LCYGKEVFTVPRDIQTGALFAIRNVAEGEPIVAFGVVVGACRYKVALGQLISDDLIDHSAEAVRSREKALSSSKCRPIRYDPSLMKRTFMGYRCNVTKDGRQGGGTENIVAIVNTVKCSAVAAKNIASLARRKLLPKFRNVTDVIAITHESGCGMPVGGSRNELLNILTQIINHPNVRAVYLLGLGCEHLNVCTEKPENVLPYLCSKVIEFDRKVITDHLQRYDSEIEAVNNIVDGPLKDLFALADSARREPLPLSYLTLGLKCGGSDIFSGICGNPALGHAVDNLVKAGGAAIITETPEFDGCIDLICKRVETNEIKQKLEQILPRFDEISKKYPIPGMGRQMVSPGNKGGGLINVFVKSASAIRKAGTTPIQGVLEYGDNIHEKDRRGLWFLDCPSYDQISCPAVGISGSQIVAFTTGLGTPIGSALGQVVKIANRKEVGLRDHIDFFAESILSGEPVEDVGDRLFELIISIASGEICSKGKQMNKEMLGQNMPEAHYEFMPWKRWGDN